MLSLVRFVISTILILFVSYGSAVVAESNQKKQNQLQKK